MKDWHFMTFWCCWLQWCNSNDGVSACPAISSTMSRCANVLWTCIALRNLEVCACSWPRDLKKHHFTRNKVTIQMGRQLNLIKLEYYWILKRRIIHGWKALGSNACISILGTFSSIISIVSYHQFIWTMFKWFDVPVFWHLMYPHPYSDGCFFV